MQQKFLVIQTAFIGDVILAFPIAQKLKQQFPNSEVHFLLRKGNEILAKNHKSIDKIIIWNKQKAKYKNLLKIIRETRKTNYHAVFNVHRFLSSSLIVKFAKAQKKIGFEKSPLKFAYSDLIPHKINFPVSDKKNYLHEVERNLSLLKGFCDTELIRPEIYPSEMDFEKIIAYEKNSPYIVIAPNSVWFTKELPFDKWGKIIDVLSENFMVYLIGAASDFEKSEELVPKNSEKVVNLCGKLSLLQSAALMKHASRVFTNDSSPMHLASAMNAPTTAIFCSTVPEFGFGPLADKNEIICTQKKLDCQPCEIHGLSQCPEKHFDCGKTIDFQEVINSLK